jgi:hypothetical protein
LRSVPTENLVEYWNSRLGRITIGGTSLTVMNGSLMVGASSFPSISPVPWMARASSVLQSTIREDQNLADGPAIAGA